MKGKEKCKALKELRQKIAEVNDIEYAVGECTHQGDCKGTCPKCESELLYLERELERRARLGKAVVLTGLSACLAGVVSGCGSEETKKPWSSSNTGLSTTTEMYLDGEVEIADPTTTELTTSEPLEEDVIELDGDVAYIEEEESTDEGTTEE